MIWVTTIAVLVCCGFAVGASLARLRRLKELGEFQPRSSLAQLRKSGEAALASSSIPSQFHEDLALALRSEERVATAACNEVMFRVQGILDDGIGYERGAWRICLAASGAGLLLVVWSAHWAALLIGAIGVCSTGICAWIGRSAGSRRRRAREAWNALIQAFPQSFRNLGRAGEAGYSEAPEIESDIKE